MGLLLKSPQTATLEYVNPTVVLKKNSLKQEKPFCKQWLWRYSLYQPEDRKAVVLRGRGHGPVSVQCPLRGALKACLCNTRLKTLLLRNQNRASLQLGSVHLAKINLKLHGSGSSSREENDYPLQCSCLENSMEPDGRQSVELQRVGHNWTTNFHFSIHVTSSDHATWICCTIESQFCGWSPT